MTNVPRNIERLSLSISEVLDDIGVNYEMIMKRRTLAMFLESVSAVDTMVLELSGVKVYIFGSQSEGSTSIGIDSDIDSLLSLNSHHVIHDWAAWNPGLTNLLMVQDETTAPGYCLLQLLRDDAPLAATSVPPFEAYFKDTKGRILLKNTVFHRNNNPLGSVQHGPAGMVPGRPGVQETDVVIALHCEIWPIEGRRWLNRRNKSGWPAAQLKFESENSGCFLVPVGSKISRGLDELEWRISTSLAERYLMFSLNKTHVGCYVLMKMLLKTHRVFQDVISSYMCKTALFHCIENTTSEFWQDRNLVPCLNQILRVLYNFIYYNNCPHFIIPENNLMADRISAEQRQSLLDVIQHIIRSEGGMLFEIETDDVGARLHLKMNRIIGFPHHVSSPVKLRKTLSGLLCYRAARCITELHALILRRCDGNIHDAVQSLLSCYVRCNEHLVNCSHLEQEAISNIIPLLCSTIGSLLASYSTEKNIPLSVIASEWLKFGLNYDMSSGLLKLATVHYSVGDIIVAEAILRHVEQKYGNHVLPIGVNFITTTLGSQEFYSIVDQIQVTDFRHIVSYCVMFMHCEINIVPQEMRQEYFRSTPEDIQYREPVYDNWMDLAVIDSLPYLYFLQYKTYKRLGNPGEQQRALHKLQQVIRDEPNLRHSETALNLLGQCMEQENLPNYAFHCYERSLQVRPRNNAANFCLSKLLAK